MRLPRVGCASDAIPRGSVSNLEGPQGTRNGPAAAP